MNGAAYGMSEASTGKTCEARVQYVENMCRHASADAETLQTISVALPGAFFERSCYPTSTPVLVLLHQATMRLA